MLTDRYIDISKLKWGIKNMALRTLSEDTDIGIDVVTPKLGILKEKHLLINLIAYTP